MFELKNFTLILTAVCNLVMSMSNVNSGLYSLVGRFYYVPLFLSQSFDVDRKLNIIKVKKNYWPIPTFKMNFLHICFFIFHDLDRLQYCNAFCNMVLMQSISGIYNIVCLFKLFSSYNEIFNCVISHYLSLDCE